METYTVKRMPYTAIHHLSFLTETDYDVAFNVRYGWRVAYKHRDFLRWNHGMDEYAQKVDDDEISVKWYVNGTHIVGTLTHCEIVPNVTFFPDNVGADCRANPPRRNIDLTYYPGYQNHYCPFNLMDNFGSESTANR